MHIHKLQKTKHGDFLAEKRRDPITGEEIFTGNEIVICAACKSAFLKETWEYLGRKHCGQRQTAAELPQARLLSLKKHHLLGEILYEAPPVTLERGLPLFSKVIRIGFLVFMAVFIALMLYWQSIPFFAFLVISLAILGLVGSGLQFKKPSKSKFKVRENGVNILKYDNLYKSYPFHEIEELHLRMELRESVNLDIESPNTVIGLRTIFKTGYSLSVGLSECPKDFRKISHHIFKLHEKVTVSFSVQNIRDYEYLKRLAQKAQKDIEVVHDSRYADS